MWVCVISRSCTAVAVVNVRECTLYTENVPGIYTVSYSLLMDLHTQQYLVDDLYNHETIRIKTFFRLLKNIV